METDKIGQRTAAEVVTALGFQSCVPIEDKSTWSDRFVHDGVMFSIWTTGFGDKTEFYVSPHVTAEMTKGIQNSTWHWTAKRIREEFEKEGKVTTLKATRKTRLAKLSLYIHSIGIDLGKAFQAKAAAMQRDGFEEINRLLFLKGFLTTNVGEMEGVKNFRISDHRVEEHREVTLNFTYGPKDLYFSGILTPDGLVRIHERTGFAIPYKKLRGFIQLMMLPDQD